MKLKDSFITHEVGGEQVMVSSDVSGFSGLVRSNKTAAFIVESLKNDTSIEAVVDSMVKKYDAPKEVIEADVKKIVDKLDSIGAIEH